MLGKMDSVSDLWITALDWVGSHPVEHNSHSLLLVCVDSKNDAYIYSVWYFLDNFQPATIPMSCIHTNDNTTAVILRSRYTVH